MDAVHEQLADDYEGLDRPVFVNLRHALVAYQVLLRAQADADFRGRYEQELEALAVDLEKYNQSADANLIASIGYRLGWLADHRQAPELIAAIRARSDRPNVHLMLSQRFITAVTQDPVEREDDIRRNSGRVKVFGRLKADGIYAVYPIDSLAGIRVQARFWADAGANATAFVGPIRARLRATSKAYASADVRFDGEEFNRECPRVQACARGKVTCVRTKIPCPLVDGVISGVVQGVADCAQDQISEAATKEARNSLRKRVAEEVDDLLVDVRKTYQEEFRGPLVRKDAFPRQLNLRSSSEAVFVTALAATGSQLAAPDQAPAVLPGSALTLQAHETGINNLAESMFAGEIVSEHQVSELLEMFDAEAQAEEAREEQEAGKDEDGEKEEEDKQEEDPNALRIHFALRQPISVRFNDSQLELTVRGEKFSAGRQTYPPMNITLQYRVEAAAGHVRLVQAEEPEFVPPRFLAEGPGRLSGREVVIRRLLRNLLREELQSEYELDDFLLPRPFDDFGKMVITQLIANDGWLAISATSAQEAAASQLTGAE